MKGTVSDSVLCIFNSLILKDVSLAMELRHPVKNAVTHVRM